MLAQLLCFVPLYLNTRILFNVIFNLPKEIDLFVFYESVSDTRSSYINPIDKFIREDAHKKSDFLSVRPPPPLIVIRPLKKPFFMRVFSKRCPFFGIAVNSLRLHSVKVVLSCIVDREYGGFSEE